MLKPVRKLNLIIVGHKAINKVLIKAQRKTRWQAKIVKQRAKLKVKAQRKAIKQALVKVHKNQPVLHKSKMQTSQLMLVTAHKTKLKVVKLKPVVKQVLKQAAKLAVKLLAIKVKAKPVQRRMVRHLQQPILMVLVKKLLIQAPVINTKVTALLATTKL